MRPLEDGQGILRNLKQKKKEEKKGKEKEWEERGKNRVRGIKI